MTRNLSAAQNAYLASVALVDLATEQAHAAAGEIDSSATEAAYDAWQDRLEDAEDEAGLDAALDAKRDATIALLKWARKALAPRMADVDFDVDLAFRAALGEGRSISFATRAKLVALICRLDAATI